MHRPGSNIDDRLVNRIECAVGDGALEGTDLLSRLLHHSPVAVGQLGDREVAMGIGELGGLGAFTGRRDGSRRRFGTGRLAVIQSKTHRIG